MKLPDRTKNGKGRQHEIIRNRLKKSETELFVLFPVPLFRFLCPDDLFLFYFIFHEPNNHGKNIFGRQSGNYVPDSIRIHYGICRFLYVLFQSFFHAAAYERIGDILSVGVSEINHAAAIDL